MKALLGNQATRVYLSSLCKHCEADGVDRLEVAIALLTGEGDNACTFCRLSEKLLVGEIMSGTGAFGVERKGVLDALEDPYWRKGLINVIKGIATFGVRRPFVPGAPFQVVWDVTHACNLRCKHCYASAGKADRDELSTEAALELIDRLAAWGVPIVAFSGGEPLMRPDILELISKAHERGIYVALATNGTLITEQKAADIKEAGAEYLQISLDGADPSTHDHFRGVDGAFDRTMEGIKNAVAEGFFVSISTTATRANKGQIPAIIDLGDGLGVKWIMVYNFVPAGRGIGIRDADLSPAEREELLKELYERNSSSNCQVLTTAPSSPGWPFSSAGGTRSWCPPTSTI
jgi:sulfatase maturation enzyme AslB (radical SAM superfamily)